MKLRIFGLMLFATATAAFAQVQPPVAAGEVSRQQLRTQRAAARSGRLTGRTLNLTDAQKQQMKTIRQQTQQTAQPVRDQMQQNREALKAAVKSGNAAEIQSLSQKQGELAGKQLAIRSQARAQIYAGLTNEQRQKLDAVRGRMQQRLSRRQANSGLGN